MGMLNNDDDLLYHIKIRIFQTYFTYFRNPTPSQILGLHFDVSRQGQLRYLNINTTFNSSIQINYRQTESAFWSMYLPTVIGHLVPTYPPVTEVRYCNSVIYNISSIISLLYYINCTYYL